MSALSDHGMRWLSHSSLDLARVDLGLWSMRYLFGVRDPANAAMARGLAVELGCQIAHTGGEFDDPAEEALKEFNKRTALGVDGGAREKERANIKPMVEQYLTLFDGDLPKLEGYQRRVEIEIPGIDIPCMGYTDFDFEDAVIDLKTTMRLPSAISASHRRQGAIYQRASGNRAVDFIYLTPKKSVRHRLTDSDQDWLEVCETAKRLNAFLEKFDTKEEIAAAVIPNFDHFYWSSPQTRAKAKEIFGY
jgi:hypothetical protein